jgi:two-component system nitrogen regulation response regulator NtrX
MDCKSDIVCLSSSPGLGGGTRKKVLIVDDECLITYVMQRLIENEGYSAFTAGCGDEALRLFNEQKPDIVILDIHLPDTNGLVLLKTIKNISPSVVVIMATGCSDLQNSAEAMKMGALAYLEKPVSIDTLMALMHSIK